MSQPVAIRAATERDLELSTEDREVLTDSDIKALVRWMDTMQNGVSAPERRLASTLLGRTLPPPIYLLYTLTRILKEVSQTYKESLLPQVLCKSPQILASFL